MADFFRYILFRAEAWTFTGILFMAGLYLSQILDVTRPRDSAGVIIGTVLFGGFLTGIAGGACALIWQTVRIAGRRHVPNAPALTTAIVEARPGLVKGAIIGGVLCLMAALVMTALFTLTNERTGTFMGSRIIWLIGCTIAGAAIGSSIASVGGLTKVLKQASA
jgi:hypothetical protein